MNLKETFTALPAWDARTKIPEHKRKSQWRKSLAGGLVFLSGLLAPWKLGFPWQAGVGISAFGAFMVSQQLVIDFAKTLAQAIGAIVGAFAGKKDEGGGALTPLVAGLVIAGGTFIAALQSPMLAGGSDFSFGLTVGVILGEGLAMFALMKMMKTFGAYSEAHHASTQATMELTRMLKTIGEASLLRAVDVQRSKEVA